MQRRRERDRVHAVEGVGEVDDPLLLADRGDRLREGHAAGDLLRQEQADHLALVVGLDLLARDHDQLAPARLLGRFAGAAEDVVVGDRDRAEPLRLGMVEQLVDLDRAVVRPGRVHVQVGEDPGPVGERLAVASARPLAPAEAAVDVLELPGDGGEVLRLGSSSGLPALALAQVVVLGKALERGRRKLRLVEHAGRIGERRAGRRRLEAQPSRAGRSWDDDRGFGQHGRAGLRLAAGADAHPVAERQRDPGPGRERLRSQQHRLPAGQLPQRAERRACDGQRPRMQLDRDQLPLRAGPEEVGVDAGRDDPVVTGEALRRRRRSRLRRGDEHVDPGQQLLAQRPPRRVAEPVGREEAGDAERLRVTESQVRDARKPGLEAVDDVEPALLQREPQVRPDADRDAEARAP